MSKIKSAVITTLLVVAIAVLAFFALFSWQVPGSEGVKRYNSFISSIHLGSDLTGQAETVLYPEGVISAADYNFGMPEVPAETDEDYADAQDKYNDYIEKYAPYGSVYIDKEVLEENGGEEGLKEIVLKDAAVLNARYDLKGYSGYSVSVQDNFTIKVTIPTNFTYSAYKQYDSSSRSDSTTAAGRTLQLLAFNGDLTLRNSERGYSSYNNIVTLPTVEIDEYISNVSQYAVAGNYAVRIDLTEKGRQMFKTVSADIAENATDDTAIGFYVGDYQLLSLSITDTLDESSLFISVDKAYAQDYAVVLNTVVHGNKLTLDYNSDDLDVVYGSASLGDSSAIFLAVALILIVVAAIVYSIVRYKKLGLVNTIIILMYSLALITAILLLEIQVTLAGAFTAVLGLALLCGSNFALFEAVRKETKKGKTMPSSVKSGYKSMLFAILDLHVVLVIAALLLTLIGVGELASCGLIFFIATVASYVLYWFTRFMWYVISSPVRNKFGFCGFAREDMLDD